MENTKIEKKINARPLSVNQFKDLPLHIIIPFKNNHHDVGKLLDEIYNIRNVTYSIGLVDDNSENKNFIKQYQQVPFIRTYQFEEDKGFGYCVNHAVKNCKSDIVFVMHSDVYNLPKNIFRDLTYALHYGKKDKLACVSAMVDNPMPKSCSYLKYDPQSDKESYYRVLEGENFLPFVCCAFSKNAFGMAGGFPAYPLCWFEDKLLSEKFRAFGYNIGVSTRVSVRHHGAKTINELLKKNPQIAEILKSNKTRYLAESEMIKEALQKKKTNP